MAFSGKKTHRLGESALSALPLIFYLALSASLVLSEIGATIGYNVRQRAAVITQSFWWLATLPTRVTHAVNEALVSRDRLKDDNDSLRHDVAIATARLHRLQAASEENARLRALLGGLRSYQMGVRLVGILDLDLDAFQQRWVLNAGRDDGVAVGQALLDAGGIVGQVIEVDQHRAVALLLTDPDHAIPVQIARTGLRAIAYGTGRNDRLSLPEIPQSADIRVGDTLLTSGIGGRFPAGFPVGVITALHPDSMRLFVIADAAPSAQLNRGREVLLVSELLTSTDVGPPQLSQRAPVAKAAATTHKAQR